MTIRETSQAKDVLPGAPDALCLDFANTRYWRGRDEPVESLQSLTDVIDWSRQAQAASPAALHAVSRHAAGSVAVTSDLLTDCLTLRESIYRIFATNVAGESPATRDLGRLNAALLEAPPRVRLVNDGAQMLWRVATGEPGAPLLLTRVLWSAADLVSGPRVQSVRRCANPECLWLFLDDSKSANRRWCQMSACGNRAKAQRFYERHRRVS